MGVTGYEPRDWGCVEEVGPREWHDLCCKSGGAGRRVLLDLRNYYESRIGWFVDGGGRASVRPGIRRFGQWPVWVRRMGEGLGSGLGGGEEENREEEGRDVLAYCTGGIRCEKGVRFMVEKAGRPGDRVFTLRGGIAAYLMWMDGEIREGRKRPEESLFKGRNYVFDARGSTG